MNELGRPSVTVLDDKRPEGPLILIAEDQAMTRLMTKGILKQAGFNNIMMASDGAEAVRILHEHKFDLVICDWNMPNALGIDILRAMRRGEKNKTAPFIMLTSETGAVHVTQALDAGVSDYITKPFTSEVLVAKVVGALKKNKNAPAAADK